MLSNRKRVKRALGQEAVRTRGAACDHACQVLISYGPLSLKIVQKPTFIFFFIRKGQVAFLFKGKQVVKRKWKDDFKVLGQNENNN